MTQKSRRIRIISSARVSPSIYSFTTSMYLTCFVLSLITVIHVPVLSGKLICLTSGLLLFHSIYRWSMLTVYESTQPKRGLTVLYKPLTQPSSTEVEVK